jgi:hypothetical protein
MFPSRFAWGQHYRRFLSLQHHNRIHLPYKCQGTALAVPERRKIRSFLAARRARAQQREARINVYPCRHQCYKFCAMARPSRNTNRDDIQDGPRTFFVTSKTNVGGALLQTERMANLFIDVLRTYVIAKKFRLHDFVVMPNHFHLQLTLDWSQDD